MRSASKTKEQFIRQPEALPLDPARLEKLEADRKRVEEELRKTRDYLGSLLRYANAPIIVWDTEQRITIFNTAFEQMTGYMAGEVMGQPLNVLFPEASRDESLAKIRQTSSGEYWESVEIPILRKDGEIRIALWNSANIYDKDGKTLLATIAQGQDITDRKRVEEALREEEKKLRLMFESITDGITVTDLNGVISEVNERVVEIHGFDSKDEVVGKGAFELIAPHDHERAMANMRKTLEQGSVKNLEYTLLKADGSEFPGEISASVLNDASGNPIGFIAITKDITERKRAEEALQESEGEYKELAESISDVFFALDKDLRYTYWNKASEELTGIPAKDALGKHLYDIFPNVEMTRGAERTYRKAIRTKESQHFINEYQLGGKDFVFEISAYPKESGLSVFVKDISERKRVEEKIKHAAEEWRTTFDSITDLIWIQGNDSRLVRVNKALAHTFKMKPKELIGKTCYEVIHGTKEPVPNCPLKKTLETGKPATANFFEPHLGIHLEVSTSPIFNEKGEVVSAVHVARDITERKKIEEQLIITDRLASVGEMASGVAHEINNPLTSIIGFSQLLMEANLPGDVKEDIGIIYSEAKRTAEIVRNLLTFARKHEPTKQVTNINSVIKGVLNLRDYERRISNIRVNSQFDTRLPEVMVDYFQMQQVFLNIIINAESAMLEAHNGGTLTVTTKRDNNVIQASFTDDGPGIAKETLNRIFDPFFTTKEVGKGTGLGLSICHGIVAEHGGRIYARSKLGKGATFIVELPVNTH